MYNILIWNKNHKYPQKTIYILSLDVIQNKNNVFFPQHFSET